jgi:hypothetical protein
MPLMTPDRCWLFEQPEAPISNADVISKVTQCHAPNRRSVR